jgi:hypothetical protein
MPEGTADRLRGLIRGIEQALFLVELEGPAEVAAQADTVMRSIVSELRAARGVPPRGDVPSSEAMHRQVNQSVVAFKVVARAALDAPDTLGQV